MTECPSLTSELKLDQAELRHIQRMLQDCGGNKLLAARRLGISRSTLYEKLRQTSP